MHTQHPTRPHPTSEAARDTAREVPVRHEKRVETIAVETAAPAERAPRRRPRYVVEGGRRLRAS